MGTDLTAPFNVSEGAARAKDAVNSKDISYFSLRSAHNEANAANEAEANLFNLRRDSIVATPPIVGSTTSAWAPAAAILSFF